ncbi:hypothetical protein PR202_ga25370 [Eleusine coracana subsp. coracana]|uniref:Uncharacterized protein n=1 Tax=Eleusine coracana subsp. coracana TaxID=191504 RepID=A0AAV5DAU6_ELECO|nr:hypothetical protein PR202_ga25370 [Eleusine coracana subsp. coracana]
MAGNWVVPVACAQGNHRRTVEQRPGTHLLQLVILKDVDLLRCADGVEPPLEEGDVLNLKVERVRDAPPTLANGTSQLSSQPTMAATVQSSDSESGDDDRTTLVIVPPAVHTGSSILFLSMVKGFSRKGRFREAGDIVGTRTSQLSSEPRQAAARASSGKGDTVDGSVVDADTVSGGREPRHSWWLRVAALGVPPPSAHGTEPAGDGRGSRGGS